VTDRLLQGGEIGTVDVGSGSKAGGRRLGSTAMKRSLTAAAARRCRSCAWFDAAPAGLPHHHKRWFSPCAEAPSAHFTPAGSLFAPRTAGVSQQPATARRRTVAPDALASSPDACAAYFNIVWFMNSTMAQLM
jgi:hypothetical protein